MGGTYGGFERAEHCDECACAAGLEQWVVVVGLVVSVGGSMF